MNMDSAMRIPKTAFWMRIPTEADDWSELLLNILEKLGEISISSVSTVYKDLDLPS